MDRSRWRYIVASYVSDSIKNKKTISSKILTEGNGPLSDCDFTNLISTVGQVNEIRQNNNSNSINKIWSSGTLNIYKWIDFFRL